MKERFDEILEDLNDWTFSDNLDEALKMIRYCYDKLKCHPEPYSRIFWYYTEEEKYAKDEGFDPRDKDFYSGIIIPPPFDRSLSMFEPFEHGIVIVDRYPTEMCSPDVDWVTLKRLLSDNTLVEVYQ